MYACTLRPLGLAWRRRTWLVLGADCFRLRRCAPAVTKRKRSSFEADISFTQAVEHQHHLYQPRAGTLSCRAWSLPSFHISGGESLVFNLVSSSCVLVAALCPHRTWVCLWSFWTSSETYNVAVPIRIEATGSEKHRV